MLRIFIRNLATDSCFLGFSSQDPSHVENTKLFKRGQTIQKACLDGCCFHL